MNNLCYIQVINKTERKKILCKITEVYINEGGNNIEHSIHEQIDKLVALTKAISLNKRYQIKRISYI